MLLDPPSMRMSAVSRPLESEALLGVRLG